MIKLDNEDKLKLKYDPNIRVKHVDLSIGSYYAKYCFDDEIFKELLGKKIFDMVGINCPNYYMYKDEHCVLSEDLNKYNHFYLAEEITKNVISINDLKNFFEYQADKYNSYTNIDELMYQIYMMHFIDMLFSNVDRYTRNYGFYLNQDNTGCLVVFDNGEFLTHFDMATRPVSFPTIDPISYVFYSKEAECKYFMEHADDKVMKMIKVILSSFNLNTVRLLMKEIEHDTNYKFACKNRLMLSYLKNYLMVYKVFLLNNKQNKKRYLMK